MALRRLNKPSADRVLQRDTPADYTADEAPERVLHINMGFLKFGTNDKLQGAAIVLAVFLLILISAITIYGISHQPSEFQDRVFNWLTNTFLVVLGVAVGRAGSDKSND
jgi:hypothetical protein